VKLKVISAHDGIGTASLSEYRQYAETTLSLTTLNETNLLHMIPFINLTPAASASIELCNERK